MAQIKNIDITPSGRTPSVHVSQDDVDRTFVFNITDGTDDFSLSGKTVKLQGTKPSGLGYSVTGTVDESQVTFTTTAEMTDEYGKILSEVVITEGSAVIGTGNVILDVERNPHPEGTTDGRAEVLIPELTILVERVEAAASSVLDMEVVAETLPAGSDATYSYDEETNTATFGIPRGADGSVSPGNIAPTYSASATYAVGDYAWYAGTLYECTTAITTAEAWTAGHWTQAVIGNDITDLKEDKADKDGTYPDMTVGNAEQIVSTQTEEDTEPYGFRATVGDGDREYLDAVVGGSVAWNQLLNLTDATYTDTGITYTRSGGTKVDFSGTLTDDYATCWSSTVFPVNTIIVGHRYLFMSDNPRVGFVINSPYTDTYVAGTKPIYTATGQPSYFYIRIHGSNGEVISGTANLGIFDLTAMFGQTIADHIYSLEQANAGDGVAFFRKLFPEDYYPYNAGELKSVEATAHETTGKNLLQLTPSATSVYDRGITWKINDDGTVVATGTLQSNNSAIHIDASVPIGTYKFNGSGSEASSTTRWMQVVQNINGTDVWSDADYQGRDVDAVITSSSIRIYLCVKQNPPSSGIVFRPMMRLPSVSDSTYEPYSKHSYPLAPLTLRGIPKLVDGKLAYDGDRYLPSGEVERRYGVVDLGTLTWGYSVNADGAYFHASVGAKAYGNWNITCNKYPVASSDTVKNMGDKEIKGHYTASYIYTKDSAYTDAATFKSAMSGVMLIYELATPTTESADPYTRIQVCDPDGTEEFISTSIVPVGHVTNYPVNLREKLENLPTIPAPPTTDGTYTIKATVSGGVVTYAWESDS